MSEIVKFNCDKFTIIEDDPRFITAKFFFGLCGENYNGSVLEKEDYENNKGTIGYTPICGYFKGQDFDEHHPRETPLGGLLSFADCDYSYEEYEGNLYATAKGIIAKEYLSKESENILKSNNKKISIEIEVLDKEKLPNGKFRFKKWIYQCITIIGNKYQQGMKNAHLEVLNNPREKYATFIEHTIETFSKKDTNNSFIANNDKTNINNLKKEVCIVNEQFKKAVEKYGLNSKQIVEILNNALSDYKYKSGEYEYEKYWVKSFDEEFVYVCDYEDNCKTKRMKYEIADNVATVDLESAEEVVSAGYMPVGEKSAVEQELETYKAKCDEFETEITKKNEEIEIMSKKVEDFEVMSQKLEDSTKEKETMSKQLEEKQDSVIKMGKELDDTKAEFAKTQEDLTKAQEQITTKDEEIAIYVKKDKENEAEKFIAQYADKLTEDEQKELKEKVHTFANMDDYKKEIKAFVCDKYEDEVKGKTSNASFSYLGYIPQNQNPNIKGDNWMDYLPDYQNQNQ